MRTDINGLTAEAIGAHSLYNILMQAPVVFSVTKGKNHVLYLANDAAYTLWGKGPDMLGKPLLEALPELSGQGIVELFDQVYNTGETYSSKAVPVTSFATGKAKQLYFDIVYQPYYESGRDQPAGVVSISYDVTALVESRQKVEESEERFRTMANSIPQLAWMTDAEGSIYWYNDRWYDYTGTTPEEMLGWGWQKVHHPKEVERVVTRFTAAIKEGKPWEDIFPLRGKDGSYRWFLSRSIPVRNDDGSLLGWFGTNTDITEQRATEEALKQSEEQLLLALEGGELGYYDYNVKTGEFRWSARTRELFGVPPDITVDYDVYINAIHPADRKKTHETVQQALAPNGDGRYENTYRVVGLASDQLRWLRSKGKTFYDDKGKAIRLAGVTLDITKQKEAEEALLQSESNLRNLVLQAPIAMGIGNGPEFVVEVANERMLEIWEKQAAEIIGRPVFDVLPEAGEQGLQQILHQVYATGERFVANEMPVSLPRNDKIETVFLNFIYEPIKNPEGKVEKIVAVATDVTELVVARKKVEESHKEAQFVMDSVPQIIWLALPDGYHYYYNKQWTDYTGLALGVSEGEGWNNVFHPDDQERAWERWSHSLQTGEPYEIEYRLRRQDGEYHWFLGRAVPIRDETGAITKWFGTGTEIHDQKTFAHLLEQRVRERTRELQQSNSELQQFVHMSSHDLKEPVRKITVFINQLQKHLEKQLDDKSKFYLGRVQSATARMFSIIDGVLAYSTVAAEEESYELVDLNKVVKDVEHDLELRIRDKAATVKCANLPQLKGVPVMLHQVFYNLFSNSLKFSRAGVAPVIAVTSELISRNNKTCARILVSDNGIGFEQKYAEKIFGSFTRLHTKDEYEGAGLGLSLCKTIIERHQGSIKAKSMAGEGTEFEILLPMRT